jgi:hypothetical protein
MRKNIFGKIFGKIDYFLYFLIVFFAACFFYFMMFRKRSGLLEGMGVPQKTMKEIERDLITSENPNQTAMTYVFINTEIIRSITVVIENSQNSDPPVGLKDQAAIDLASSTKLITDNEAKDIGQIRELSLIANAPDDNEALILATEATQRLFNENIAIKDLERSIMLNKVQNSGNAIKDAKNYIELIKTTNKVLRIDVPFEKSILDTDASLIEELNIIIMGPKDQADISKVALGTNNRQMVQN